MYIIKDESIIPVQLKPLIESGDVIDARVLKIEAVVADHFNTNVHELNVFYKDTEAKKMCCFLIHDMLQYTIGSVAHRYKIDARFLRNNIHQMYRDCLTDVGMMHIVTQLKDAVGYFPKALQNESSTHATA